MCILQTTYKLHICIKNKIHLIFYLRVGVICDVRGFRVKRLQFLSCTKQLFFLLDITNLFSYIIHVILKLLVSSDLTCVIFVFDLVQMVANQSVFANMVNAVCN